jgi:hypothetical protein
VRIQSGQRETRTRDAEPRQLACGEIDDVAQQIDGDKARDVGERDVHRCEHDLQRFRPEHHHGARSMSEVRQQIGVSFPGQPRTRKRELVHRGGGDRGNPSGEGIANGRADGLVGRAPGVGG